MKSFWHCPAIYNERKKARRKLMVKGEMLLIEISRIYFRMRVWDELKLGKKWGTFICLFRKRLPGIFERLQGCL